MSQRIPILHASQEYRACAKECRRQAESFRDRKTRSRVLQIAADYERKARKVEASAHQDIKIK